MSCTVYSHHLQRIVYKVQASSNQARHGLLIEYFAVSVPFQTLPLLSDRFSVNGQNGVGVGCELPLRWGVKLEKFAWVGLDAHRGI
jgi:hypothetical protein